MEELDLRPERRARGSALDRMEDTVAFVEGLKPQSLTGPGVLRRRKS